MAANFQPGKVIFFKIILVPPLLGSNETSRGHPKVCLSLWFPNDYSCLYFQSPWLLQLTLCFPPKDTIFLSPVGLQLSRQTHFPSPSLLSYLHLDGCSSALASSYLSYHIQYTVLLLVSHAQQGQFPKYLFDLMRKPLSVLSSSPLRSADRVHLLVSQTIELPWTNIVPLQWLVLRWWTSFMSWSCT